MSGSGGNGVVFELPAEGGYSVLNVFAGGSLGAEPAAPVILDSSGDLYGTTRFGGTGSCSSSGCGVVYELVKSSSYSETVLHAFTGGVDGGIPLAPVVMDSSGNFYGTTSCGGKVACSGGSGGDGVVFKLASGGTLTTLHTFAGKDGALPIAGLTFDTTFAYLYGTTYLGGSKGLGVAFRIAPSGTGFAVLHSFVGGSTDGANPSCTLDLFQKKVGCPGHCAPGTTTFGGIMNDGVVFKVSWL
jgi:uncharacterized repeat protein (TIGR03803 family)